MTQSVNDSIVSFRERTKETDESHVLSSCEYKANWAHLMRSFVPVSRD